MGFDPKDLRNYVHLRSLLDVFEQRVLEYCSSPKDPQERFERIIEIKDALACKRKFPSDVNVIGKCSPPCGKGQRCEGHACVHIRVNSGWPKEDPRRWDA